MSSEEQEALQRVYQEALDKGHIIPGTQQHLEWKDIRDDAHRLLPEDTGHLRSGILYPEDKPMETAMPANGHCDCGAPWEVSWSSDSGYRCLRGHKWINPARPDIPQPVEIPVPGRDPMVHVAGECLTLFGRYMRQRCAWCGTVLLEYDLARIAVPVGQDPTPAQWPVGSQVFVDNSGVPHVSYVVETEELEPGQMKIADDSCLSNPLTLLDFR